MILRYLTHVVFFGLFFLVSCDRVVERPNIIFLLTDDQRWDAVGYAGNDIIQTPNMDDLAGNGVFFSNAYVTTSICAVSRASILSGQYARRHGIHDFSTTFTDSAFLQTYPMLMKQYGYRVGFIGKYGVGDEMPEDYFDYWRGFAGQGLYEQTDATGNYTHLTRIMGEQALEFLQSQPADTPFCLSISFKAPHVQDEDPRQFVYDVAYQDLFVNDSIPIPLTGDSRYFKAFPHFFTINNEGRIRWDLRFSMPEKYQESVKGYYRLIKGVDVVIGEIRTELDRLNLVDNTVILLMGDNGFFLGEHGLAGKWYGHEESIRVPFFLFDPRFPEEWKGTSRDEIVLNIDVAPTMLYLAGLDIPSAMQGRSVVGLLDGTATGWRNDFFYEHLFDHERIPKSEGVVSLSFKYLRYIEQEPVYEEMYDLLHDPHETINLAEEGIKQELLAEMRQRWSILRQAAR